VRAAEDAQRHVLRFEVCAETLAAFREARAELRRRSAASIDDEGLLLEMARLVLGGPRDDGRASYQISVSVCPDCERGRQQGATNGYSKTGTHSCSSSARD